jgi:hypothetical protein
MWGVLGTGRSDCLIDPVAFVRMASTRRSLESMPARGGRGSAGTGLLPDCGLRTDCTTCEAWHLCQGGCGVWRI